MKKIALGLALLSLVACNSSQKKGSSPDADSSSATSAPSASADLFSCFLSQEYAKTEAPGNESLGFYTYLDDNSARNFTLYDASDFEQHWGIGGVLTPVEGKTNKYSFAAQDNFNGLPEVYNGTLEFVARDADNIQIIFENTDGKYDDFFASFPKSLTYHKKTEEDFKKELFHNLNLAAVWMNDDNVSVHFNLDNPEDLGGINFESETRSDNHKFIKIKSVDVKNQTLTVETSCSREGDDTHVDFIFSLLQPENETVSLKYEATNVRRPSGISSDCYLAQNKGSLIPVYGDGEGEGEYDEEWEELCFTENCVELEFFDGNAKETYDGGTKLTCEGTTNSVMGLNFFYTGKYAANYSIKGGQYNFQYSVVLCEENPHGEFAEAMSYNACMIISRDGVIVAKHPVEAWTYSDGIWVPEPYSASFNEKENTLVIVCICQGIDGQGVSEIILDKNNEIKQANAAGFSVPGIEEAE